MKDRQTFFEFKLADMEWKEKYKRKIQEKYKRKNKRERVEGEKVVN